jgi:hypothetical protein
MRGLSRGQRWRLAIDQLPLMRGDPPKGGEGEPRGSVTCPRCGAAETDPVLASQRFCGICQDFTGRCGASFIAAALLATGVLEIPGWSYPCTSAGTERWQLARVAGSETGIGLCAPHGDCLRAGAASWMKVLGLTLNPAGWS